MSSRTVLVALLVMVASLAGGLVQAHAAGVRIAATSLQPHAPIDIEGDAGFNATNGVVSGAGTAADPYIIQAWQISAGATIGVQIRNAAAHVIVRDVAVGAAGVAAFYLFDSSNVTFANVTAAANSGEGMRLESSQQVAVLSSTFTANQAGVVVLDSSNVTIASNNISLNSQDGVAVTASPLVTIEANNISVNGLFDAGYGVHLAGTTEDIVTANQFAQNGIFIEGTGPEAYDSHRISADNLVLGLPILYEARCNGLNLANMDLGELLVMNCAHVTVSNVTVSGADVGVEIAYGSDVVLGPNVTVSDAPTGVHVLASSFLDIEDTAILNTGYGLLVDNTTDVRVEGTKISAPSLSPLILPYDGVAVHHSDRVNLTANIIRHFRSGVEVEDSGNVSVVNSTVALNVVGFNAYRASDLVILGSLFAPDSSGLRFLNVTNASIAGNAVFGAILDGMNVSGSSGVVTWHNRFVGDANWAFDDNPAQNRWDAGYPTGGNFWGNYRGVDLFHGPGQNLSGPDGIGDTPYLFKVNAGDRYPLMTAPSTADVPPEALFSVSPAYGNVRTVFSVSANFSSDYEDGLGGLQVRWAWDTGSPWTPWTSLKFATHVYDVPGAHTIELEVGDVAGLTDRWSTVVEVAPKPDNLPPSIEFSTPTTVDIGQPIPVVANISDPSGVLNATLLYRGVGDSAFSSVPMGYVNGTNYSATIPAQRQAGTVDFVIVANDSWGNEARAPLTGYDSIAVVDPLGTLVILVVIPAAVVAVACILGFLWYRRHVRRGPQKETPPPPGNP